jgi:hypothetical protein
MSRILTSIHGKLAGIDSSGRLVVPKGFVAGENGSQVSLDSPSRVSYFDDFLGDVIADQWNLVEGTDGATSDAAIVSTANAGIGGVLRITTGDAGTGLAADLIQINQALQWQASNGDLVFQARLKLSAITTCSVFLGFTDTVSLEAPVIGAGVASITTTATDAVGFLFDTTLTNKTWHLVGVAADVDATFQNSTIAPVAAQYQTFRVEVSAAGLATFFINGVPVGTAMSGAVTPGTDLTPVIGAGKLSVAASMLVDVDYVHVSMNRAADGGAI